MENNQLIAPNSIFSFTIETQQAGLRLDKFLKEKFPFYSRSFLQNLIEKKLVSINGIQVDKPSISLKVHDTITVQFPDIPKIEKPQKALTLPVEVLYEHEHFFIINKPAHLMVHKPAHKSDEPTLVDWILKHSEDLQSIGHVDRPGIVHRLDKDTSGIMVIPRTNYAHNVFSTMFSQKTIQKIYYAIVQGHPDKEGIIDLSIGRSATIRTKMQASSDNKQKIAGKARHAITSYKVLTYFEDCALVQAQPLTGRTHQIRVHFAAIGHPIIGDSIYGKKSPLINRQALHAYAIAFTFDTIQYQISAPLSQDIITLIEKLTPIAT